MKHGFWFPKTKCEPLLSLLLCKTQGGLILMSSSCFQLRRDIVSFRKRRSVLANNRSGRFYCSAAAFSAAGFHGGLHACGTEVRSIAEPISVNDPENG